MLIEFLNEINKFQAGISASMALNIGTSVIRNLYKPSGNVFRILRYDELKLMDIIIIHNTNDDFKKYVHVLHIRPIDMSGIIHETI